MTRLLSEIAVMTTVHMGLCMNFPKERADAVQYVRNRWPLDVIFIFYLRTKRRRWEEEVKYIPFEEGQGRD